MTHSAAKAFNDNLMGLNKDYVDVDDQPPAPNPNTHKPGAWKWDTQSKAQRLYDAWKVLVLLLVLPFLAYMNKSASRPTANTLEQDNLSCINCPADTQKTTWVLCLFWEVIYSVIWGFLLLLIIF
jgi:hypothetical protein